MSILSNLEHFFNIGTQFSSIWPIERTLSGAATPGQNGPSSNDNEWVLHIPQSFSITVTSLSDCLVSYPGHPLWPYHSAVKKSLYSITPDDWANEAGFQWITSQLPNIVIVSPNSNVLPLKERMYPCLVKSYWLFFLVDFLPSRKTIHSEAYIARIRWVRPTDKSMMSFCMTMFNHAQASGQGR